jgi:hypothetical protein
MKPSDAPALWAVAAFIAGWAYWTARTGKIPGKYGPDVRREESPYVFWGFVIFLCFASTFFVIWGLTTFVPWPSST